MPDSAASDFLLPPTNEGRSQFGNIFIGVVIRQAGTHQIPTSSPDDIYRVPLFDIEVEQALKGDAAGEVRIMYDDYNGEPGIQKLVIGERYLFFAGFDPDTNQYPVDAEAGAVLVKNDRQAAELVATYEPLIRSAERNAEKPAISDPWETPSEAPSLTVEPAVGAPGDHVRLTGGPFVRREAPVSWDGKGANDYLLAAPVGSDCMIDVEITIPKAKRGEHRIIAYDAAANEATVTFTVTE